MLIAVNYHYVRPQFPAGGIIGITPAAMRSQLERLATAGAFVSADDVLAHVEERRPLPERALLVTFDDGLREHFEEAWPVLQQMGIPALFFVNTRPVAEHMVCTVHMIHMLQAAFPAGALTEMLEAAAAAMDISMQPPLNPESARLQYPWDTPATARLKYTLNFALSQTERRRLVAAVFEDAFAGGQRAISQQFYLDPGQIRRLSAAGCIGTHGWDHLPIAKLTPDESRHMIEQSIQDLVEWTGRKPRSMSYPYGTVDTCTPAIAEMAGKLGIRFAFTVEMAGNDEVSLANPYFLGRFDCNYLEGGKSAASQAATMFEQAAASRWHGQPVASVQGLQVG